MTETAVIEETTEQVNNKKNDQYDGDDDTNDCTS